MWQYICGVREERDNTGSLRPAHRYARLGALVDARHAATVIGTPVVDDLAGGAVLDGAARGEAAAVAAIAAAAAPSCDGEREDHGASEANRSARQS